MSKNLELWNSLKTVPESAQKVINAGRLQGFTEISPVWRMYAMTEKFGPVGVGWKYSIDKTWAEAGSDGQVVVFVQVSLQYATNAGGWSDPIPGIGGSMLVANEKKGPHTSDEAYKMSLTDALGSAMKAIGVGADIYSGGSDFSKYLEGNEARLKAQYQHLIGSKDGLGLYCMMLGLDEHRKAELHNSWGPGKISHYKRVSVDLEAQGFEMLSNVRNGIEQDDPLLVVENLEGITLDGKRYMAKVLEDDQLEYIRAAVSASKQ